MKTKIIQIGNSLGIVIPKDALTKMNVEKGDLLHLTASPEGFRITPYDEEFEDQMNRAREIMKKRRDVLRELAK